VCGLMTSLIDTVLRTSAGRLVGRESGHWTPCGQPISFSAVICMPAAVIIQGVARKKTVNSSTAGPNYKPTKHLDSLSLAKHTQSWRRLYKLKRIHYNEEGQSCFQR